MQAGLDSTRGQAVKNFLAYSLKRLRVDHIDIYRPSRLDPQVPIEDTIGAIADLIKAGYFRFVGLSEVGVETIRRAHAVHPISDLQIEYAIVTRGPEAAIFPVLQELGIGVTAYGVLSRGLLSGSLPTGRGDLRGHLPRFSAENLANNQQVIEALKNLAKEKGITPTQLAIAWVLAKASSILPVVGARTRRQLEECLRALHTQLSSEDLVRVEQAVPGVAGTRYDPQQMRMLDNERR